MFSAIYMTHGKYDKTTAQRDREVAYEAACHSALSHEAHAINIIKKR